MVTRILLVLFIFAYSLPSAFSCSVDSNLNPWYGTKSVYTVETVYEQSRSDQQLSDVWISKIFSDTMWNYAVDSSFNSECTQQGHSYLDHLRNNTLWAIRMLDASVVTPSGLLSGDDIQFGNPDQCTNTRIPIQGFSTKYCLPRAHFAPQKELYPEYYVNNAQQWPPYAMEKNVWDFISPRDHFIRYTRDTFRWGICVPNSCTTADVQTSLNKTLSTAFAKHGIHFEVSLSSVECYSEAEVESRSWSLPALIFVSVWLVLLAMALIGTTLEYKDSCIENTSVQTIKPGELRSFFLTFSMITNTKHLTRPGGKNEIILLDGVKGFMMTSIVMFHRAMISMGYAKNLETFEQALHSTKYFLLSSTSNVLDTFFFASGFLLAWGVIKKLKQNKSISYSTIIMNRLFRIYPMYIMCLVFIIWVLPNLGYGPLWKAYTDAEVRYCKENWWQNLLFVSNLRQNTDRCMAHSYYLSTDFQLFLISLLLIYFVNKYSSHRKFILIGACVVAHLVPSIVIYLTRDVSFWLLSIREFREHIHIPGGYTNTTYDKFYIRIPPYIFGVCLAYLTDHMVRKEFHITAAQKFILFFTTVPLVFVVFIVGTLFYLPNQDYNVWFHVIYAIPFRLIFAVALGFGVLVHICCGYGAIDGFFSLPIWMFISRPSYHIFLINYLLIPLDIYAGQSSNYVNIYMFTLRALGDVTFITLLSYITTILLEPPMEKLRRHFLQQ